MINGKTVLGIIPARGGSKRIPRKNLVNLAGRPLIAYTIEAGLRCQYIDELQVSTDDEEIARMACALGAKVPFIRPSVLAMDESSSMDVVRHSINYYKKNLNKEFDYVVLLQPTSPLRDYIEIDKAFELLLSKGADAVISVCAVEHSPLWSNTLPADLSMAGFIRDDIKNKRSQDLEPFYRLNGAIYICDTQRLLNEGTFLIRDSIYGHVMPQEKSPDIDTKMDLALCEALLKEVT